MRPAAVLGLLQGKIELVRGNGDAQSREVLKDLVTLVRRRLVDLLRSHRGLPQARADADNRWSGAGRWLLGVDWDPEIRDAGPRVRRAKVSAWNRPRGCAGPRPGRRRRSERPSRRRH